MAQIQTSEVFADGQLVTGERLNNITLGATALGGLITEQYALSSPVENSDSILIHADGGLKQTTVENLFQSDISIKTELVEGDGLTLRQSLGTITIGNPLIGLGAYPSNDVIINGNTLIHGNYTEIANLLKVTGDATVSGDITCNSISGNLAGDINASGNFTSTGTANFTGNFQVNGNTGWVLTDIVEETIPSSEPRTYGFFDTVFESVSHTKTTASNEVWVVEFNFNVRRSFNTSNPFHLVALKVEDELGEVYYCDKIAESSSSDPTFSHSGKFILNKTKSHNGKFVLKYFWNTEGTNSSEARVFYNPLTTANGSIGGVWQSTPITSVFRLTKYKTA